VFAVNGTAINMGTNSNTELSLSGTSLDGNISSPVISIGGGTLYIANTHFENPTCSPVLPLYISQTGGSFTTISSGEILDDCSTSTNAQLFTMTGGTMEIVGPNVFSGRTITNILNNTGGGVARIEVRSSTANISSLCSNLTACMGHLSKDSIASMQFISPFITIPASTSIGAPAGIASSTIMWTDPTSDGMWKYNPGNNGEQHVPQSFVLTSQYTNSTTTFTTVSPFSFPVSANKNYNYSCHLFYQAAATGGLNIQFTGPASPTAVVYGLNDPSAATTFNGSVATAYSTSLGQVVGTAATNFDAIVSFGLVNGTNAGTVALQAKSSAAVQLQIQPGSYCQWQ